MIQSYNECLPFKGRELQKLRSYHFDDISTGGSLFNKNNKIPFVTLECDKNIA